MKTSAGLYQEGPESTFTHKGKVYQLDPFLREAETLPTVKVEVSRLAWVSKYAQPDPERVRVADLKVPILFTVDREYGYVVIDGFHRLTKAIKQGLKELPGKEIPEAWFLNTSLEAFDTKYTPVESKQHRGWFEIPGFSGYCANRKGQILVKKTGKDTF